MSSSNTASGRPVMEGYLYKQSRWMKQWRKRYFRLIGNTLYASTTPEEAPHHTISLAHVLTVKSAEEKTGKSHAFEVATPEEVYYMYAESDEAKDDWIGKIGKAIVDHSRSHIRTNPSEEDEDDDDDDDDE